MSTHGRNRGRFPRGTRTVPPHVIAERRALEDYKRRTTPEQRERHAALLFSRDPDSGRAQLRRAMAQVGEQLSLGDQPVGEDIGAAFGNMTCCFCDKDVSDGRFVFTVGSRLRCFASECHERDVRWREELAAEGKAG